ncbi:MAG TPA: YkgJ family cysteine cluster protein [Tepidisphaeraceae bacterium]|nr:YkgJ family cysteine cluster protein [Tepidisphaeraceae bacterium]
MATDPIKLRVLANEKENENWKFRQFLKHQCELAASELDERVVELTKRVWAGIDCTTCANCCKEMKPTFGEEDISRVARRLGVERQQFVVTYLEKSEAGDEKPWQTRTTPCPFLKDNRCSIYEDRPADCRGYPYLDAPDFTSRMMGMIDRTFTCPIVYEVMEQLKKSLGYSWRKHK